MSASPLTGHVLAPVANEDDARITADALAQYELDKVTVVNVIEKGEGVPDKSPVEQSEQIAAAAFAAFHDVYPDAPTRTTYRRDVVQAILDTASEVEATAIAFRPRGGSRVIQLLSGDLALRLITEADRPVIALPTPEDA